MRQIKQGDALAVYGTLMHGLSGDLQRILEAALTPIGSCLIYGTLIDLGSYPGLVPSESAEIGHVKGELWRIDAPTVMEQLDAYEDYDPANLAGSLYVRRWTLLAEPETQAWVYHYNGSVKDRPRINHGDWRCYIAKS